VQPGAEQAAHHGQQQQFQQQQQYANEQQQQPNIGVQNLYANGQQFNNYRWPPMVPPVYQQPFFQQMAPPPPPLHQIKLTPFWTKDVASWFTLTESTFNRYRLENSRLRFDIVLQALPEDTIERVRAVLRAAPTAADPYQALKARLLDIYTPSPLDLVHRIMFAPELGGRRPSELMDSLLAALPPGEPAGILFKAHFLSRLPTDFRDLVAVHVADYEPVQLAALADQLWMARNARPAAAAAVAPTATSSATKQEMEDLEEMVAAISMKKEFKGKKKWEKKKQVGGSGGDGQSGPSGQNGQKSPPYLCRSHLKYGDQAHSCADTKYCKWKGN